MKYTIKRGDETYGPYTLADIQEYVSRGNIALSDLAQSEGMTEWLPVSKVLGDVPVPAATGATAVAAAPQSELPQVPLPSNLHWIILLILDIVTRFLFNIIWAFVQANWARKLDRDNKALIYVAMYPAGIIGGMIALAVGGPARAFGGIAFMVGSVLLIIANFAIKAAMETYYNSTENVGLQLSGALTFFLGTLYLQYHINQLAKTKKQATLLSTVA